MGSVRSIAVLLFGIALLSLGNGLQGTLLGVRASIEEFGADVTGVVMSGYALGLLLGSLVTPTLVGIVGHIRVFAALASIISTAVLLMVVFIDPVWWFAMRVLAGMSISGLYIVAESWLNSASGNETRGRLLSVYMVITYASMGLGQLLLNVSDPGGYRLFILVSALVSIALVPISLVRVSAPEISTPRSVSIAQIYRGSPLAVVACFFNGFSQAALFSMGAVYGTLSQLSVAQVSLLMALPPLGIVISQYPIGLLSDRYDRRKVLMVLAFASAALAFLMIPAAAISIPALIAIFMCFGAVALPLYSLALAHANDHLQPDQILGASGKLVLLYGIGGVLGPFIVGQIMAAVGPMGFPIFLIGTYGTLALFTVYRMTRRPVIHQPQGELIMVAPRTTPVAMAAIAEEYGEHPAGTDEQPPAEEAGRSG